MFCRKEGWSHQGTRASMLFVLSILLLLASGCAAVRISPAALKASTVRTNEAVADLRRWQEAVYLCNLFLNSTNRKTLPPGQLRLTDDGMAAQERSDGFVVGGTGGHNRLLDNSFLKHPNGPAMGNAEIASLTLHELTHTYYRCGTVSFEKGVMYYLEAVFLFRYRNHSMERLPFQTSAEFMEFLNSLARRAAAK